MKIYFAPMEGITGLVCRNASAACFEGNLDKYFAPFITATTTKELGAKELKDIAPEKNNVPVLVPQILANDAYSFIRTAERIVNLGYREINLNLGCPSKTVVTKKKGAGFLEFPHKLDNFLEEVCRWTEKEDIRFSVKTRLGMCEEEEFGAILEIFNQYPLYEVILHPRTQDDYYVKPVREGVFEEYKKASKNPLIYNGDLFDEKRLRLFFCANPEEDTVMIGRGLLMHPGMTISETNPEERVLKEKAATINLWKFHDKVYEGYRDYIQGEKNVLFKMKELWSYMETGLGSCADVSEEKERRVKKALKQIRKSQKLSDYEIGVALLKSESGF